MKKILALLALAACFSASAVQIGFPPRAQDSIVRQNLVAAGTATAGSCVAIDARGIGGVAVGVTGTYTGALSGQVTVDNSTWTTMAPTPFAPYTALNTPTATIGSGATGSWQVSSIAGASQFRVCGLGAMTGSAIVTLQAIEGSASSGSSGGGTSDATAANQTTQISHESRLTSSAGPKAPGAALATTAFQVGGTYNSGGVTLTNTQEAGIQMDAAGNVKTAGSLASGAVASGAYAAGAFAAGAGVDGWDLTKGAKADAVCATDTGTCSQIAISKKIAANLTTLAGTNAQLPTALGTGADSAGLLTTWTTEGKAQLGSLTETAPASDTASSGLNGRLQRVAQNITTLNGKFTATANADPNRAPVSLDIASPVTGSAAAAGVLSGMPFAIGKGAQSIIVDVTANTATSAVFEASADGTTAYQAILCYQSTATGAGSRSSSTATTGKWECPSWGTHFQVRQTGAGGVTATVTPIARPVPSVTTTYVANTPNVIGPASQGSSVSPYPFNQGLEARTTTGTAVTNGQVVRAIGTTDGKPAVLIGSVPELAWNYAAAANGIVNTTTAVTVKAACTDRCYVNRLDLMCEALTNATEIVLRDGAATVLWRTKVGNAGLPLTHVSFQPPRRGASASLIEVATLTASGAGACYVNVDGYDAK